MWLQHKTIVLTGASGGLGSKLAQQLAPENKLILIGRDSVRLEALRDSLPGEHHVVTGDLNTSAGCSVVISQLVDLDQTIDVLINNAGATRFTSFERESERCITNMIALNLTAPVLLACGAQPLFSKSGSRVVNIGSTFGSIGYPGFCVYSASKFGLRGFSEALSREWANSAHSVIYIAPRAMCTEANCKSITQMNQAMGNTMDPPEKVARQVISAIENNRCLTHLGWPEKIFSAVNNALPGVVTRALTKRLPSIKAFMMEPTHVN